MCVVCCVLLYNHCHRVKTHLQLINITYRITGFLLHGLYPIYEYTKLLCTREASLSFQFLRLSRSQKLCYTVCLCNTDVQDMEFVFREIIKHDHKIQDTDDDSTLTEK
jgi:hypothetical protein